MNASALTPIATAQRQYRSIQAQRVLPVFVASIAVIVVLTVTDVWLAGIAARHRTHVGQELFDRGMAASKSGRAAEALELFRGAFNRNPTNREYHLAFARSLRENGRNEESKAVVRNLLEQSPTYGDANAEFARMLAGEDDWQQASWYYHRALYGDAPFVLSLPTCSRNIMPLSNFWRKC
jgi:tetratricopeptide (TPR) repeat protein